MGSSESRDVLVIHSFAAPFRLPVFERLDDYCDVTVLFCKEKEEGRKWQASADDYSFDSKVLPHVELGLLILNYTIVAELLFGDYDAYVMDGNPPNLATAFLALFASKIQGREFVLWTENIDSHYFEYRFARLSLPAKAGKLLVKGLKEWYQTQLYRRTDRFVAFSKKAERHLVRRGVNRARIETEIQAMPAEQLATDSAPPAKLPGLDDERVSVLFLGYLREGKGVDTLVEAYTRSATDETQLLIAGSGPDEARLRRLAADRDDVHFVGFVEGGVKHGYLDGADVFVLPTRHDAWGMVTNEAMYHGLPVITTTEAGSEWLVDDDANGFVVKSEDADALADRLTRLFEDDSLRAEMGETTRENAAAFDPDTMARAVVRALER